MLRIVLILGAIALVLVILILLGHPLHIHF